MIADVVVDRTARGNWARRDCAVLYRTNAQSRALEDALRRRAIPYRLVGAVRFYDRREIRDLMAYLKLVANPADDEAFRRAITVPRRGLGDATIALLAERATLERTSLLALPSRRRRAGRHAARRRARRSRSSCGSCSAFARRPPTPPSTNCCATLVEQVRYAEHLKRRGRRRASSASTTCAK